MSKMRLSLLVLAVSVAIVSAADGVLKKLTDYPNALCLDGSHGAYYVRYNKANPNNWIIFHEGGGWCYSAEDCIGRSATDLGSSNKYPPTLGLGGMLSDQQAQNEFLYEWNVVYLKYCDGSSFSGHRDAGVKYPSTTLYYRGKDIKEAALADLRKNFPIDQAKQIIISGCSAGGLSTYIHLDWYRQVIPASVRVVGMPDAGWFLDEANLAGQHLYASQMTSGFALWNSTSGVNQKCLQHYSAPADQWHCVFAQYIYPFITTPIFVYNARFDSWSLGNILQIPCAQWQKKLTDTCNAAQMATINSWGEKLHASMQPVLDSKTNGLFVDACNYHCQIYDNWEVTKIDNAFAMVAFNNWLTGSTPKYEDNCNYGCNPTCKEIVAGTRLKLNH